MPNKKVYDCNLHLPFANIGKPIEELWKNNTGKTLFIKKIIFEQIKKPKVEYL